jgi:molybdate transport system regulatory protein
MGDLTPKANVWIERQGVAVLGTREASLLEAIERVRSIKEAAREAGISYRTAWGAVQQMERALGRPVVNSRAGGPGGGSTTLTEEARDLLRLYETVQQRLQAQAQREFQAAATGAP